MLVSVTDVCSLWLSEHRPFGRRNITFLAVVPTQLVSLCVTCIYHVCPPPPQFSDYEECKTESIYKAGVCKFRWQGRPGHQIL